MLSNFFGNLTAAWKVDIHIGLKHNVFFPGNVIEGVVTINVSAPINFNAVRLKICGKEKVHIQRGGGGKHNHKRHYYATNVVIKQLITLSGDLKYMGRGGNHKLPPGNYAYPFAYQLPMDLPPSFRKTITDDTASIIYYCKAYVDIPMGRDAVVKTFFTVVRPMPASQWIHRGPVSIDRMFNVTCCCCIDKGKVSAAVSMDRTCIAMDRDWLQVFASVDNTLGKEPVDNLEICLRHTLTYMAHHITETHTYIASRRFVGTSVPAGQRGIISGVVDLPRNLIPSFTTPNIHSKYMITVELNIPWATDPCVAFPVFVAQSVDDTNITPPVAFDMLGSTRYTAGRLPCPEFYYSVPPNPVFPFQPITSVQPPPSAAAFPPPPPPTLLLPSAQWVNGNQPPPPVGAQQQFQWYPGYQQHAAPQYVMPPPPTQPGAGDSPPPPQYQPNMAASTMGYAPSGPAYHQGAYGAPPPPLHDAAEKLL